MTKTVETKINLLELRFLCVGTLCEDQSGEIVV